MEVVTHEEKVARMEGARAKMDALRKVLTKSPRAAALLRLPMGRPNVWVTSKVYDRRGKR